MPWYRCYFLGYDGKIVNVAEADHPDDGAATAWGSELLRHRPHYRASEVWLLDRQICRHNRKSEGAVRRPTDDMEPPQEAGASTGAHLP